MTEPLESVWDDYPDTFRKDAHQLLAWSYTDTRPGLAEARDEYEITGLLTDGMNARIDSPQTPERFTHYAIHNEKPTSPSGELGKRRPKLDIQIECGGMRPRPRFTFEAKRLRDDAKSSIGDTMRHYLGMDGIQRFVRGQYVPETPEAAMLGCIQAHDAEFWFIKVGNAFESDTSKGGNRYAMIGGLQHANIIADFPDERVSVHARAAGNAIRIFHLFIDCR
jgi:hypothetical protein